MKKYIKQIAMIMLVLFTAACTSSKKGEETAVVTTDKDKNLVEITVEQFQNSKMKLGEVSLQTFNKGVVTNGHIDVPPANIAHVSAVMGGYVKISSLLIGDNVKKGQLLLTLENPDFIDIQQRYLETYERLTFLKSEFERQKTLFEEKITSQKNYLKAESEYKSNIALFNGLEQKIRLMNLNPSKIKKGEITSIIPVYAPISGSVAEIYTNVGKFMAASEVLIKIIDSSHKHLELIVFEKDVLSLEEGQIIQFEIPENSERTYMGEVHLIGKSIDQENRTVSVHGHLSGEDNPFIVGMYVEAEIITYTATKMALPIQAFIEENDRYFVLVLRKKHNNMYEFEKTPVHIGLKSEAYIEIVDIDEHFKNQQILIKGVFIPIEE